MPRNSATTMCNLVIIRFLEHSILRLFYYMVAPWLLILLPSASFGQSNPWIRTKGPYGATVVEFSATPRGTLLARTNGELYRSTNLGLDWSSCSFGVAPPEVLAVSSSRSGTILACSYRSGIFRSTDEGQTWNTTNVSWRTDFRDLCADSAGFLYAGTYRNGIFRSSDDGVTWDELGLRTNSVWRVFCSSQLGLFAVSDSGLFKSVDRGSTWTYSNLGFSLSPIIEGRNAMLFSIRPNSGIVTSIDGGVTWNEIKLQLSNPRVAHLARDSSGNIYAAEEYSGILKSTDNGKNWIPLATRPPVNYVYSVFPISSSWILSGGFEFAVLSTDGGNTWNTRCKGMMNTRVPVIVSDNRNNVYAVFQDQGFFRTTNYGETWEQIGGSSPWALTTNASGRVYVSFHDTLWRTSDGGDHWESVPYQPLFWISSMAAGPGEKLCAATGSDDVFLSNDAGSSWKKIRTRQESMAIDAVHINPKGFIFVSMYTRGIVRSRNDGATWENLAERIPYGGAPYGFSRIIAVDPLGTLYANAYLGLYRSFDDGDHWELVNDDLVFTLLGFRGSQEIIGAGISDPMRSTDQGKTWNSLSPGGSPYSPSSLAVTPSGYVFIGTNGYGVFRTSDATSIPPSSWKLLNSYPNPFNSSTTLSFEMAAASEIDLSIYDILGQRVVTLVHTFVASGRYSYTWSPRDGASGVYFIRLAAGSNMETQKVLFVK